MRWNIRISHREGVFEMTPRSARSRSKVWTGGIVLILALAFVLSQASVAYPRTDEFGGASFTVPYAPYTAGPAVSEVEPYAPYTAGPVVREIRPYTEYVYPGIERIGNYLLK